MTPYGSATTIPATNDAFLAALLGIRPDVLSLAPAQSLQMQPQRAVKASPAKTGPKAVTPSFAAQVARFIAELAPGTGEGIAAAETLDAIRKGQFGAAGMAALGLIPVAGDALKGAGKAAKAAAKTDLDAIMWSPNTGYFEGIKGNKTVLTAKYNADELRAMLGEDTWNRLVSTDYVYNTYRLEAQRPGVVPKPPDPDFPPRPGPFTPQKPPAQGTAKIVETLAALGLLGGGLAQNRGAQ